MNIIKLRSAPRIIRSRWLPLEKDCSLPPTTPPQEQGYADGYEQGKAQAIEDYRAEMEQRIQTAVQESRGHWDSIAKTLNHFPRDMAYKLREELVSLTFATVKKILAATPISQQEIEAHVKQMLDHVEAGTDIEIQLHPEDLALMTAEGKEALWNEELTHLKWTANASIPRGSCVLRGEFGWMDGRQETRLHKLQEIALDSIRENFS